MESRAHDESVVPRDLRLGGRGRWRAANVVARRQGTPLARTIPPWRWISASWWFVALTKDRADTAGIGGACFTTWIITPHPLRFRVAAVLGSLVVIGLMIVGLLVSPGEVLRSAGPLMPVGILAVIVAFVENARTVPLAWRRRHTNDRAAAAVRSTGHTGTIAFVGGLVSENTNDVIELGRRWLRHVDEHGIALITDARTERLAHAYTVQGFQQVTDANPLLLIRLPRSR